MTGAKTIGVIGAGTMGNGIAQVCALAGLSVVMLDVDATARSRSPI
jgi:3-hydroxybutyryl-CoA dehydrogenase